jgi:hypothetical protein
MVGFRRDGVTVVALTPTVTRTGSMGVVTSPSPSPSPSPVAMTVGTVARYVIRTVHVLRIARHVTVRWCWASLACRCGLLAERTA